MGCMGWDQLARELVSACHQAGYINFKEGETLTENPDHRKTITICHHIMAERQRNPDLFYTHLERALQPDEELAHRYPIYKELYKLRAVFVTTNADELFARFFNPEAVVHRPEEFPGATIDRTKLYHIHGTIRERQSLVFRLDDYIRRYGHPRIQQFLKTLFSNFTIFFVGYGLSELQLLEYIILSNSSETSVIRHYYLMPMYQGEENILEFQRAYYSKLGIQVEAYDMTEAGYHQLYHVIHEWQSEINRVTSTLLNTYEYIEQAVSQYGEDTAGRIFQLIKHDKPYEDHFFKHVSNPDWLIPLRDGGYFDPSENPPPVKLRDNPGFVTVPYWNVLAYLERIAGQLDPADSDHYRVLMKIVRDIVDHRDETGKHIENVRTDWSLIKILSKVPASYLEPKDMDRVTEFLQTPWQTSMVGPEIGISLLPHLIASRNEQLLERLFSVVLGYRWESRLGREEVVPLIDDYWLGELLKKHLGSIVTLIPVQAARTALSIIEEIANRDATAFYIIVIPSIAKLELEPGFQTYERFVVRVARDCLMGAVDRSPEEMREIILQLLSKDHAIFKRLALFVISSGWELLSPTLWEVAGPEVLVDAFLSPEVRQLERTRFGDFSDAEKEQWLDWIESAPYSLPDDLATNPDKYTRYTAHQKLRHLSAIKDSGHARAVKLYQHYVEILGFEPEEEKFEVWSGPVTIVSESERLTNELLQMNTTAIVESLKNEAQRPRALDLEDMGIALQEAAQAAPEKFVEDLPAFAAVPHKYQVSLLAGLRHAWKGGGDFDWSQVLRFCQALVLDNAFWRDYDNDTERSQIVSEVADLIWEGTVTDSRAFDQSLLPFAEDILLALFNRTPSDVEGNGDLGIAVLNSSKGRIVRALLSYSLRVARLKLDASESARWPTKVKREFDRRLDRSVDDSLEFSFTLGEFLANLYYLNRQWVLDNIDLIFPKENDRHWKAAFSGYLSQAKFYKEFYDILRRSDHYSKALDTSFEGRHLQERLIHHVCLAYLEGSESLGDPESLFEKLLSRWDTDSLSEVIRFFWMQRKDRLQAMQIDKVLAFWQRVAHYYEEKEDQLTIDEKKLLSSLSKLSVYLEELDDRSLGWLKLTGKYAETGHDTPFLVEQLDRLAATSPRQVADIYIGMLETGVFPDYDMSHIVSCVEKLYGAGERDRANAICNLYLSRGFEDFREIFKKHNE